MSGKYVMPKIPFIRYDGTNPQAIINRYANELRRSASVAPDGTVTITEIYGTTLVVPPNTILLGEGTISNDWVMTPAEFEATYYLPPAPVTIPPAPTWTLHTATGQAQLPVLTVASPLYSLTVTLDTPLPTSVVPADVRWRALSGATVMSAVGLQAIASPVVLNASGTPAQVRSVTLHLRNTGGIATISGIVLVDIHKLTSA